MAEDKEHNRPIPASSTGNFEGNPYISESISPTDLAKGRKMLATYVGDILVPGDAREKIREKIDTTLSEYIPDSARSSIDPYIDQLMERIGTIEVLDKNHPLYQQVMDTVAAYNKTHPQATIAPPAQVILSDNIPTMYHLGSDTMVIDRMAADLPANQREAVIAHELRHKYQATAGQFSLHIYTPEAHARAVSPQLEAVCKAAGLSDEQIAMALPSTLGGYAVSISPIPLPIELQEKAMSLIKTVEDTTSPFSKLKLQWQLWQNPDCKEEINHVYETLGEALQARHDRHNTSSRQRELDADKAAAETSGVKTMADALEAIHKTAGIHYSPEDDSKYDHPSLETRLKAIGCEYHPDATETVVCPPTPAEKAPESTNTSKAR